MKTKKSRFLREMELWKTLNEVNYGGVLKSGKKPNRPPGDTKPFIRTAMGIAFYSHTETEDEYGNWNDRWQTIRGEFVIHDGKKHHVYLI